MSECEGKQTDLKVNTDKVEGDMRLLKEKSEGLQTESAKKNEEMQRSLNELKGSIEKRMCECEEKQTDLRVHTDKVEDDMRSLKEKTEGWQMDLTNYNEEVERLKACIARLEEANKELKLQSERRRNELKKELIEGPFKELKEEMVAMLKQSRGKLRSHEKEASETMKKFNEEISEMKRLQLAEHTEGDFQKFVKKFESIEISVKEWDDKMKQQVCECEKKLEAHSNEKFEESMDSMKQLIRSDHEQKQDHLDMHRKGLEVVKEKMEMQLSDHKVGLEEQMKELNKKILDDLKSKKKELDEVDLQLNEKVQRHLTELEERATKKSHEFDESEKLMQRLEQYSQMQQMYGEKLNEHQRQLEHKSLEFETLKKVMGTLRDQIGKAEEWINQRIGQPTGPVMLEMHNYKHYREHGGDWYGAYFVPKIQPSL